MRPVLEGVFDPAVPELVRLVFRSMGLLARADQRLKDRSEGARELILEIAKNLEERSQSIDTEAEDLHDLAKGAAVLASDLEDYLLDRLPGELLPDSLKLLQEGVSEEGSRVVTERLGQAFWMTAETALLVGLLAGALGAGPKLKKLLFYRQMGGEATAERNRTQREQEDKELRAAVRVIRRDHSHRGLDPDIPLLALAKEVYKFLLGADGVTYRPTSVEQVRSRLRRMPDIRPATP